MHKKVVVATHIFIESFSQALRDYLKRNGDEVLFVGHPLFGGIFVWGWGIVDTFWQVIKTGKKYDLYVGVNGINAFIGLQLRKLGIVKKVIFVSVDYSHERFSNKILNNIYHWLDYYCINNCDVAWNSSDIMVREREKRGFSKKFRKKQIVVPDGADPVKKVPFIKRHRYEICFVGHLKEGMGVEMLIKAFETIKKQVPKVKVIIIGAGPIEDKLRVMAKANKGIEFKGLMASLKQVYPIIGRSIIGVAPYEKNKMSENTDPAKVKLYLTCGLPIVMTRVPLVANEIERKGCGIVVEPGDQRGFEEAVIKLLKNEKLLKKCIDKSISTSKKYLWGNIFAKAFKESQC